MNDQRVELRLIGGFGLSVDGVEVDIAPSAQRLLAFVALTPRGADRTFVAGQLWPDHPEPRAKANLRSALWRVGKVPAELVAATSTRLRLADPVWLDVRDGIADLATGADPSLVAAALPFQALDDDLLPDWYDDWLTIERERLRQFRLGLLEEGGRHALTAARPARAVQLGLAAIAIDPLRESAHRLVVETHLSQGNLTDAIGQYETFAGLLDAHLGCRPSAGFGELVSEALATAAARQPILMAA